MNTIEINVGKIVDWYYHQYLYYNEMIYSTDKKPIYKLRKEFLRKYYKSSFEYTFARCKGILIHESIEIFVKNYLPNFPLYFGDNISYYKLWYYLNREFYRAILDAFSQNEINLPQINEWKGTLLCYSIKAARVLIRRILRITINRIEKGHKLENIFSDITPLIQERSMKIKYNGIIIFFKPDWIEYELNRAKITEFKSGIYNTQLSMKNILQVLIFAFCFTQYQKIPVDMCEIYYLKHSKKESIEFTALMMRFAKYVIDKYLKQNHPQIYTHVKIGSKIHSQLIPRKKKIEDYV